MTASPPRHNRQERFAYSDYLTWPDDERWELIDGGAYNMSPAPGSIHQRVSMDLSRQFSTYLKGKPCKVFAAPFDVRLSEQSGLSDDAIETVVQPDLVVVCDPSKLDDRGCKGAPEIVVEIVSPSTGSYDLTTKFDLYQKYAVKEYWIVMPGEQAVMVFKLQKNGVYGPPDRFGSSDRVVVEMLDGLIIELAEVFAE